jgi:hypothetical protein
MCWNVPAVEKDPGKFAKLIADNGFERVSLKAANGNAVQKVSRWSPWPLWGENVKVELVEALKESGIKVDFWHFVFGNDPAGELDVAIYQCRRFQPDAYIWNAEGKFDGQTNAVGNARMLGKGFEQALPHIPQGLCWWALPKSPTTGREWHPIKVARAFLETVEYGMPMMYWQGKTPDLAVDYLHKSLTIWRSFTSRPVVPIGRAFNGTGGEANGPSIMAFGEEVYELRIEDNLMGNSWYVLDKAVKNPTWMSALKSTPVWNPQEPVKLTLEEKVDRLVAAHPQLFPEL